MDNNDLLTLLIAFVLGYFACQMMGNMCKNGLLEGAPTDDDSIPGDTDEDKRKWIRNI